MGARARSGRCVGDVEPDLANPSEYRDGSGGQQTVSGESRLKFSGTESQEWIQGRRRLSPIAQSRCSGTAFRRGCDRGRTTQQLGRRIHRRARRVQPRGGGCFTRFFRNLPQLEFVRDLVLERPPERPVKIVSVGCSTGAELYSILWLIRTAQPTQAVQALGIDFVEECIQAASRGVYPSRVIEVAAISENSHERLFTREGKTLVVQDWLKEAVTWAVGDACSPDLAARFGLHDVVIANNFLFQMPPDRAESCLRNLTQLVAPNGYLVVSGVDLELRSRVLGELGFVAVTTRWEEIHAAEDVHDAWPLRFWGLEPIDRDAAGLAGLLHDRLPVRRESGCGTMTAESASGAHECEHARRAGDTGRISSSSIDRILPRSYSGRSRKARPKRLFVFADGPRTLRRKPRSARATRR